MQPWSGLVALRALEGDEVGPAECHACSTPFGDTSGITSTVPHEMRRRIEAEMLDKRELEGGSARTIP